MCPDMREMTVYGVSLDMRSRQPIVLLKTADEDVYVPVWVGHSEAAAILMKLQETDSPRPMTHDLACSLVTSLDAEITRVTVTALRDNTFHATVTLLVDGKEIEVDSRTSDAIALALRAAAPIFAADEVVEESGVEFEDGEPVFEQAHGAPPLGDVDVTEFRRFLDSVSPDEFADGPDAPSPGL
jgi:bifunctional DNase/RNase